jgi:hypothetical protein
MIGTSSAVHWWLDSDPGLLARIAIGAAIFAVLGTVDLIRHGRQATRWREYAFLLLAVFAATAYGAINDQIASSTSWEYFYYGKGLDHVLGPRVPPDSAALHWEACKIGLKATWSAGLIIGVLLLLANNPRRNRRQLPYRTMCRLLTWILLSSVLCAAIGGFVGSRGGLAWVSHDLRLLVRDNMFRPYQFMTVYGMNLGGYVGGLFSTLAAAVYVLRRRRREVEFIAQSDYPRT